MVSNLTTAYLQHRFECSNQNATLSAGEISFEYSHENVKRLQSNLQNTAGIGCFFIVKRIVHDTQVKNFANKGNEESKVTI